MAILFANNVEALMGSTEDPPDGGVVARTCIGAVIVYAVPSTMYSQILTIRCFYHFAVVKLSCIDGAEELN
jgi:hypothetical protein